MQKLSQDQSGFHVVEALLIVAVLGIIGFAGYYVHKSSTKASQTTASTVSSSTTTSSSESSKPSTATTVKTQGSKLTTNPATDSKLQTALASSDPNDAQSKQDMSDASSALNNY